MQPADQILVIGGTGMLGRPVVRRLLQEGFAVRVLVRDQARARSILPAACTFAPGDLRDHAALKTAMAGAAAVYLNLAAPMAARPPRFEPERDGTRAAVEAARAAGVPHLLRISAMGVEDAAVDWWAARHKLEADREVIESGIPFTIFRPTWFMESIPTLRVGRLITWIRLGDASLRWIAGDDFGRQVAAALRLPGSRGCIYQPQGPELLSLRVAVARFARAYPRKLFLAPFPLPLIRLGGRLSGKLHYLSHLLDMTVHHFARIDREAIVSDLPAARMKIEDYVAYLRETGDEPRK